MTVVTRDHKGERTQVGGADISATIVKHAGTPDIPKQNGTSQNGHHIHIPNGNSSKHVRNLKLINFYIFFYSIFIFIFLYY